VGRAGAVAAAAAPRPLLRTTDAEPLTGDCQVRLSPGLLPLPLPPLRFATATATTPPLLAPLLAPLLPPPPTRPPLPPNRAFAPAGARERRGAVLDVDVVAASRFTFSFPLRRLAGGGGGGGSAGFRRAAAVVSLGVAAVAAAAAAACARAFCTTGLAAAFL